MDWDKIGGAAFIIGLLLAAIIAIFVTGTPTWVVILLAVLGIIVGLLNVTDREVLLFLVGSLVFLMSFQALGAVFQTLALGWDAVSQFFNLMVVFVAPAAAIVAVKALFAIARD